MIEGFAKLSAASVYHRFFGILKELSEKQLDEFLNTDNKDHIAWAAYDIVDDDVYGVGVGRFKRSKTNSKEAELALTVIDEFQNLGVGTTLLGILYFLAANLSIEVFTGTIMSDNVKLIKRFRELGAMMTRVGAEYEMRLPVVKTIEDLPKTRYAQQLKPIMQFLKQNDFCA
jgi:acetyltransferase